MVLILSFYYGLRHGPFSPIQNIAFSFSFSLCPPFVSFSVAAAMAFRSQQLYKKMAKKVGECSEAMKKFLPDSKMVMGRANRGIFAGRHIQFGNSVSEDGGNK